MQEKGHENDDGNAKAAGGLSRQTANGFAWLVLQTVGVKFVTFGGQVVLAWLLLPEDFGIVALAYAATTFIVVFQNSGILEVLVQREKEFFKNANPAFWMSGTIGVFVGLAIFLAGPVAARIFSEPALVGMLAILAAGAFLSSFEIVPTARLQIRMRFGALAALGTAHGVLQMGLAVYFAWLGFGPYSFVLPMPIVAVLKLAVLWSMADFRLRLHPEAHHWRTLVGATGLLIAASFFIAITQQGANLILGFFHGTAIVGIFYFAYNLTIQIQTLLSLNLAQVLLPSFSKLQDNRRHQTGAYLRVTKILVLLGAPTCFLLAAIADPFVHLLFADRWIPAIPVLQLLSIGLAFNITGIVTLNLLKAQGRYGFHLFVCVGRAMLFVTFVTGGAMLGGAIEVGGAVALYMLIHGPVLMYAAIRNVNYGWKDVFSVYASPVSAAGVAAVAGVFASTAVATESLAVWAHPIDIAITASVMGGLYLLLIRFACPNEWKELTDRLLTMLPNRLSGLVRILLLVPRSDLAVNR